MEKINCKKTIYHNKKYLSTDIFEGIIAMKELTLVVLQRLNNKRDCKLHKRYNKEGKIEIVAKIHFNDTFDYEYIFGGEAILSFEQYI